MSAWLDALFGRIFNGGVSLPLSKGINFANGLAATFNQTTKSIDVSTVPSAPDAAVLAPLLRGVGLTVNSQSRLQLRPRPRKVILQDWFCTGGLTSGTIGSLAWNITGVGTPTVSALSTITSLADRKIQLNVTGAANDVTSLTWGAAANTQKLSSPDVRLLQTVSKFGGHLTNKRFFFGLSSDFATNPTSVANCAGILFDSDVNATNYLLIARNASVGSPINTGVAVPADSPELLTIYNAPGGSTWEFRVGDAVIGTIPIASLPTAGMNLGYRVQTLAAATRLHQLAYFGFESVDLGGACDDDAFLEA